MKDIIYVAANKPYLDCTYNEFNRIRGFIAFCLHPDISTHYEELWLYETEDIGKDWFSHESGVVLMQLGKEQVSLLSEFLLINKHIGELSPKLCEVTLQILPNLAFYIEPLQKYFQDDWLFYYEKCEMLCILLRYASSSNQSLKWNFW